MPKDFITRIQNFYQLKCLAQGAITLTKMFLTSERKEQIIIFGNQNINKKSQEIANEVWKRLIQALIAPYQLLSTLSTRWKLMMKDSVRKKETENHIMDSDPLMPNLIIIAVIKIKEKASQIHVFTIRWSIGRARIKMPKRTTGFGAFQQAQPEAYITDQLKWILGSI